MADLEKTRSDMNFLLSFVPAMCPEDVSPDLLAVFYITGTYEGDVKLASRVQQIVEDYALGTIPDEDFEDLS